MTSSNWFHCSIPRPDARFRPFCFPHAGGGINTFRSWAKHLAADIELCTIQLPGRDVRFEEAPFTEVSALVEPLARGLAPWLDRPCAFFGHSMTGGAFHLHMVSGGHFFVQESEVDVLQVISHQLRDE